MHPIGCLTATHTLLVASVGAWRCLWVTDMVMMVKGVDVASRWGVGGSRRVSGAVCSVIGDRVDPLMRITFGVRRKNPPEKFSGGGRRRDLKNSSLEAGSENCQPHAPSWWLGGGGAAAMLWGDDDDDDGVGVEVVSRWGVGRQSEG
ncbi:hypothetical protein Tco_0797952 [Tanacetum coccineum]